MDHKTGEKVEELSWNGDNDSQNPMNWPSAKKWTVMLTATFIMFVVELNATSITSAAVEINEIFSVSDDSFPNSYWPVTSWTFAGAIFPIILTPIIEDRGTRPGFLLTYVLFALFVIPQAVAHNFATLIVTRAVSGACGATIAAIVDGIAADLWTEEGERGRAVTVYTFALVGGYTVGPVIGGAVISELGWRWIFYIQLIIYFSLLPLLYLVLQETRSPVVLTALARKLRQEPPGRQIYSPAELASTSTWQDLKEGLVRPTQLLFTEPVLASFTLWSAFTLGMIFVFTQSIPQVYTGLYDWSSSSTGVVQIAVFIGQFIGFVACWIANDIYIRRNRAPHSDARLETRLYLSIPSTIFALSGGFFVYAWTSSTSSIHWILPTLGLALVGFASMVIVTAVDIYITDSYAKYAGSAIAAVTFGENTFSAFLPLATQSMYSTLGFPWASSLLGFVGLALVVAPIVLVWKGEAVRGRSRFMSTGQLLGSKAEEDGMDRDAPSRPNLAPVAQRKSNETDDASVSSSRTLVGNTAMATV
ncbi:hypothetical protein AAFC00_006446 [Neodothiora populina]|uniref:Major facilitator superfamily (MFS) profile domain-containing protein n=1 Tax=Neodothiora populina TaxID=2781224 RepID=A0ABR3P5J7_9PEZI